MHNRLKHLRKDILHAKQREIAAVMGITPSSYSMIETGKRALKGGHIKALAATYHVNEQWLKYGKGEAVCVSPKQLELMEEFERLNNPRLRGYFIQKAEDLHDIQEYVKSTERRSVVVSDFV